VYKPICSICKGALVGLGLMIVMMTAGCSPTSEPTGIWAKLWNLEVGPDYKRPGVKLVEQFRSEIGPSEAASIADLPWWKVFNDTALQKLVATALGHNYDLQVAAARVEEARAIVGVTASQLYPQVFYNGGAGRQKAFVPFEQAGGNITFNTFTGFFNMFWELDVWGRVRRSTEVSRARLFAQEDIRRGVMLSLVTDTATDYFALVELDRELEIAKQSAETYKQTLALFTDRFHLGKDTKLAVDRAQAAYDSSRADIARLSRAAVQEENALSVLLGANPQAIERGVPLVKQTMPGAPLGVTTDLLQRRPDILQAEQTMMGANAQIGVAVASFFPTIGLSALYGGQSQKIGDMFDSSFSIWNIAGNLSGPVFQGGQLIETYYADQAFWDETIAQYRQTALVAFREVSDALIAQQTLVAQREALEDQVVALGESVELSTLRYKIGRASYFEVLEAEQQLYPAEINLAQVQRDQLLAVVDLYKALGGGWNLSDEQWARPR